MRWSGSCENIFSSSHWKIFKFSGERIFHVHFKQQTLKLIPLEFLSLHDLTSWTTQLYFFALQRLRPRRDVNLLSPCQSQPYPHCMPHTSYLIEQKMHEQWTKYAWTNCRKLRYCSRGNALLSWKIISTIAIEVKFIRWYFLEQKFPMEAYLPMLLKKLTHPYHHIIYITVCYVGI